MALAKERAPMIAYSPVLPRFRSRWAAALQVVAMLSMVLQPVCGRAYWSRSSDGSKVWIADPDLTFPVYNPDTDMMDQAPNEWWQQDSDGDGLDNSAEVALGTDPYSLDSDLDGLTDKDEIDFSHTDPWAWDSDSDGSTDYDEYFIAVRGLAIQPVNYSALAGYYSLRDADGDGVENIDDVDPLNSDTDGDGIANWLDPEPNSETGYWYNDNWYLGLWEDTDQDSIPNPADETPLGTYIWKDMEYPHPMPDPDGDGIPSFDDPYPDEPSHYIWNGVTYEGHLSDNDADHDGVPNEFDLFPDIQGQFEYQGVTYPGALQQSDEDGDGIPNQVDPYPNPGDEFWYQGIKYVTAIHDSDHDTVPNHLDTYPEPGQGYWYPGTKYDYGYSTEYAMPRVDRDEDLVPDPADLWPDDYENGLDSDGDGFTNYDERTIHGTDPLKIDTDGDGLTDKEELLIYFTNPLASKTNPLQTATDFYIVVGKDTDNDGLPDHVERWYNLIINNPQDAQGDLDGDGISNLDAYQRGWDLKSGLAGYDSDGDGITNAVEDAYPQILNRHYFNDSVADSDGDGVLNFEEIQYELNPQAAQTYAGEDDLAYLNRTENLGWQMPIQAGDTDGDGMSDAWEHWHKFDLRSAADATADADGDELNNLREHDTWRDPRIRDYDSEGSTPGAVGAPAVVSLNQPYIHSSVARIGEGVAYSRSLIDFGYSNSEEAGQDAIVEKRVLRGGNTPGFTTGDEVEADAPIPDHCVPEEVTDTSILKCDCHHGTADRFRRDGIAIIMWHRHKVTGVEVKQQDIPPGMEDDYEFAREETEGSLIWEPDTNVICQPEQSSILITALPGIAEMRIRLNGNWTQDEPLWLEEAVKVEVTGRNGGYSFRYVDLFIWRGSRVSNTVSVAAGQGEKVTLTFLRPPEPPPSAQPSPLSVSDGAGSRFRKVGLNGMPLPDAKPQVQNENGESDEETYIDAFSCQLRHSVSDVYVTDAATLIPLMVKRDVTPDSWNNRGGLKPEERVAEPFGPGWSSNLASYIRFDEGSSDTAPSAEVVDEMGNRQRFFMIGGVWRHDRQEYNDVKTRANALMFTSAAPALIYTSTGTYESTAYQGLQLVKKFGTTCHYETVLASGLRQVTSPDRIEYEGDAQIVTYARLKKVVDRWGNELHYTYPTTTALIPSRIHDPKREGHEIRIEQALDRVVKIQSPGGETTQYFYASGPDRYASTPLLTRVVKGADTVNYGYEVQQEQEAVPAEKDGQPYIKYTDHAYLALGLIEDERGNTYSFSHQLNKAFNFFDGKITRRQYGLPMTLRSVITPQVPNPSSPGQQISGTLIITTTRQIDVSTAGAYACPPFKSTFNWSMGNEQRTCQYDFSQPQTILPEGVSGATSNPDSLTFAFAKMAITAPDQIAGEPDPSKRLVETYEFDTASSMALIKTTDRNGGVVSFAYGDTIPGGTSKYDDPTTETNAVGTKTMGYHAGTRILASMINALGVKTEYGIDTLGRRLSEKVWHPSGTLIGGYAKSWTFDTLLPGFITSETWDTSTPRAVSDITNTWFPQIKKTFAYADAATGLGWWRKITETALNTTPLMASTVITDFDGRKRSITDGRGLTTTFEYDGHGRLARVKYADGTFKFMDYDAHGNLILEVDELGVHRFHEYDSWNRRTKTTLDLNGNHVPDERYTEVTVDEQRNPHYDGDIVRETSYNSMNLPVSEIDERGVVTTHSYDLIGRRTSTTLNASDTDPAKRVTTQFSYKVAGSTAATTVNGGKEAGTSLFDVSGFKPVQTTDARGGVTKITYDVLYRPVTVQRPDGNYVHTTYDKLGHVTSTCDPTTVAAPPKDAQGRLTQTDSTSVNYTGISVTHTSYDALGMPIRADYPDGKYATTDYTFSGQPYVARDDAGVYTKKRYDTAGRVNLICLCDSPSQAADYYTQTNVTTTGMQYDASGNVRTIKSPRSHNTTQYFDARNRLIKTTFPIVADALAPGASPSAPIYKNPVSTTTYDATGRVSSVTDPLGNTTRTFYDAAGRTIVTVDARNQVSTTEYDASGHVTAVVNAKGQRVSNTYDALGRLVETTDAEDIVNSFGYDVVGNRTRVTDGLNQNTTFEYDPLNRLKKQIFANGDDWVYNYNAVNKISEVDPNGKTIIFQYDIRQRLEKAYYSTFVRDLLYNTAGRLSKVTEFTTTADKTVEYGYDSQGRVSGEKSVGIWHYYTNDQAGNRTQAQYADGRTVNTTFDALNRPLQISNDNGTQSDPTDNQVTSYGYDRAGRAVIMTAANGQVTRNTYDELGRLVARVLYPSWAEMADADRLASFTWAHDEIGNVISQTEYWFASGSQPARSRATAMSYDGSNRLLTETVTDEGNAPITTHYSYDAANNRRTKEVLLGTGTAPAGVDLGHWTYTYNTVNQLKQVDKRALSGGGILATTLYTYDANGNRLTKVVDAPTSSTLINRTTTYTWDVFNRLDTVALPVNNNTARQTYDYTYDYRTRRTGIARTAVTGSPARHTAVVFSGGLSVAEYERASNTAITGVATTTTPTVPTVEYGRGQDMGGGVGGLLHTQRNPLNASNVAVNPTTSVPATLRYNLSNGRGDIVAQSDKSGALTWTASYEAYGKRTKETGTNADKQRANTKDEDPTGLLNEGFRYRDIETGVWLSRDPAGFVDGPNLYAYVRQNPWTSFDPDGLYEVDVHRYLTQYLAQKAGFPTEKAASIGLETQRLDRKNDPRNAMGTAVVIPYARQSSMTAHHFVSKDRLADLRSRAMNDSKKDFRSAGEYFHALEDTWSHTKGVGTRLPDYDKHYYSNGKGWGHAHKGHSVDWTFTDKDKAMEMAQTVYQEMKAYAKTQGIKSAAANWKEMQATVEAFIEGPKDGPQFRGLGLTKEVTREYVEKKVQILNPRTKLEKDDADLYPKAVKKKTSQ